jgi:hypothetical protein
MTENQRPNGEGWSPRVQLVLVGFALIGGFFLIAEHQAHVWSWLPWLLLAACPLMHLFMHHGHGGHDHQSGGDGADGPDAAPGLGSPAPPGPGNAGLGGTAHHQQYGRLSTTPAPTRSDGQAGNAS